jgi:predicted RNase H-like HicB family nuclease
MTYAIIIEKAKDGSYSAYVPDLPGCTSCADSEAEVRESVREAIEGHIAVLRETNQPVPLPLSVVGSVEVAA